MNNKPTLKEIVEVAIALLTALLPFIIKLKKTNDENEDQE